MVQSPPLKIKFGTAGWRGIISNEFTINNVKLVAQAIADYILENYTGNNKEVIVGYDTRFMAEEFAKVTSRILAGNGIKSLITESATPTPVIAYEILRRKLAGGINITASHNPPDYSGIKFSPSNGGPALPEVTNVIETNCARLIQRKTSAKEVTWESGLKIGLIEFIDPREQYLERLRSLVNLGRLRKARLKVAIDLMYGTGRGYLDRILEELGGEAIVLHDWRDVLFGGFPPEPAPAYLVELVELVKTKRCDLGLALDGDADRFGIIDADGTFISPNQILGLLLDHLVRSRNWKGFVVRSVMTTSFIDAIASLHGIAVKETPVGFKFISEAMDNEDFLIGGEESGGLTIRGHVREKDGILACLLVLEMVAERGKSIKDILHELYNKVGYFFTERLNFHLKQKDIELLRERLAKRPPQRISGWRVEKVIKLDGWKFILEDGSWVGVRLSGTEPVARLYIEARSAEKFHQLKLAGERLVKG